ncbi:MAG TPA: hypothetical protein VFC19_51210 [Candidatus Limnocylindrales bacterium]|nr:hypothetical protein [Candidatus Limnocylindrales bacterium]
MTIVETLGPLLGVWRGTNRLRMLPTDDYRESAASATVSVAAQRFVTIAYTWSDGDKPQDGLMVIGEGGMVWVDSWHTPEEWMQMPREPEEPDEPGVVRFAGVYEKEWGWLIHLDPAAAKITMRNVPPGHPPYQVVEIALGL